MFNLFLPISAADFLLGMGRLVDPVWLRHIVSVRKAMSSSSQEHRVRCYAFKVGKTYDKKDERAVLESVFPLRPALITMHLLSGP